MALIKKFLPVSLMVLAATVFLLFGLEALAQSKKFNASVSFKKDSNGLFTIIINDPEGVKEFSLIPPKKFPYGGGVGGSCPRSHKITNVLFEDPADFTPAMTGYVIDCQGNQTDLEIPPPQNGSTVSRVVSVPEPEPQPEPAKPAVSPKPVEKPAADLTKSAIKYPVPELGNCGNEDECRAYCDDRDHGRECIDFAKKHKLIAGDEVEKFERSLEAVKNGPGGCNSAKSCEAYCNNVSRIDECLSWAEKNNFLEGAELEEARKINDALKRGAKMPGGCQNKNSCEAYCQSGDNMDECIAFAEAAGFMDKEELAAAKKFLPLMKSGQTPGGCKSREQCEAYCDADEHLDECMVFAEKAGFMKPEELEIARKTGGKGPGGCKREQCKAFCADPANQEACIAFAKEYGLIKEEDLKRFEEGRKYMSEYLEKAPSEVRACIEENLKGDAGQGGFGPGPEIADKMRMCFEKLIPEGLIGGGGPGGPGGPEGSGFGPGGFAGPGGCNSIESCTAYCQEHFDECQSFGPAMGRRGPGGPGEFGGPGGPPPGFEDLDQVRREHIENVKREDPQIVNCFREKIGNEIFARQRSGNLQNEVEIKLAKEALESCGAVVLPDRARGVPDMAPPATMPSPADFQNQYQQQFQQIQQQFQNQSIPFPMPPSGDAYQQEYQRQFQEQYQRQYQQQFQQMQQQYQNQYTPPPQYEGFPGRDLKNFLGSVRDLLAL